jgi:hypothetical protein
LIDQILSANPRKTDQNDLAIFRSWLHGYMCKLGRDDRNRPLQNPHPPPDELVAQFLEIAEPRRLGCMLDSLMLDKKTCYSYGWFIVVALQRIHGISWQTTKQIRTQLRDVKRPRPAQPQQTSIFAPPPAPKTESATPEPAKPTPEEPTGTHQTGQTPDAVQNGLTLLAQEADRIMRDPAGRREEEIEAAADIQQQIAAAAKSKAMR